HDHSAVRRIQLIVETHALHLGGQPKRLNPVSSILLRVGRQLLVEALPLPRVWDRQHNPVVHSDTRGLIQLRSGYPTVADDQSSLQSPGSGARLDCMDMKLIAFQHTEPGLEPLDQAAHEDTEDSRLEGWIQLDLPMELLLDLEDPSLHLR